jgi:hypothetical protein
MAQKHGKSGVVKFGVNTVGEVKSWSVSQSAETYQTLEPTLGAPAPALTYEAGASSWTASIECLWDPGTDAGQAAGTIGSTLSVFLYPEGETAGDAQISGSGIVTSREQGGSVDGMVTLSFSLQGSGQLTFGVKGP